MEKLKEHIQSVVDIYKSGNLSKAEFLTRQLIENNPKKRKYVNTLSFDFYFIFNYPKRYLKLILEWLGCEFDNEVATAAITITNKIGCIKVGAGEKWQRSDVKGYDYSEFYHFINKYESTGAINCHVDYFDSDQMAEAIDICKKHGLINDKN